MRRLTPAYRRRYSASLVATGGVTPYTWSISSGSLPSGLSLNSSAGVISGTPATAGSSGFTMQVRDAASQVDTQVLTVVVNSTGNAAIVNWSDVHQTIEGFGASSAWRSSLTTAQADMFFSVTNGIGLSLLRNRIAPDGTTSEVSIMQQAVARGAKVWSAPWSPPAAWKDNGSVNNGGHLLTSHYQDYASQLANYVANMKAAGVPIYALSLQNEPDVTVTYESCLWSAQQYHDFVPYLHSALQNASAGSTLVLAGEQSPWSIDVDSAILADANTRGQVDILAAHYYGGTIQAFSTQGKSLWETEISDYSGSYDGSISNGLYYADIIHRFLTVAEVNAWNWWYLIDATSYNMGLTDINGNPAKRMYVLGNFSKFIRPGWVRIGVTNAGSLEISAYKDPATGSFAVVAINRGTSSVTQTFSLNGVTADSVTPWVTSASLNLFAQSPVSTVGGSSFTYTIPASSVVTLVSSTQTASPGQLSANPATVTFSSTVVGSAASQTVTLTNSGGSPLTISSATTVGTGFSLSGLSLPATLAAGASTTMTVNFAPSSSGTFSGSVSLVNTGATTPVVVALSGTAVAAVAHSVELVWSQGTSSVVGFNVYRGSTNGGPYTKLTSSPQSSMTYTDYDVTAGQTYYYVVTAVDANGMESDKSSQVVAVIPIP